jgi:hypothetical protein
LHASGFDCGIQITNRPTTRAAHFSSHVALGFATGSLNYLGEEGGEGKKQIVQPNRISRFLFINSFLMNQKAQSPRIKRFNFLEGGVMPYKSYGVAPARKRSCFACD